MRVIEHLSCFVNDIVGHVSNSEIPAQYCLQIPLEFRISCKDVSSCNIQLIWELLRIDLSLANQNLHRLKN